MRITHGSGKNTGAMLEVAFRLNENRDGGTIHVQMSPQKTSGSKSAGKYVPPTFDRARRIGMLLTLAEVGELVMHLSGKKPEFGQGNALFHRSKSGLTAFSMKENESEKYAGSRYLSMYRRMTDGTEFKCGMSLSVEELFVLKTVLGQAMFHMAFGTDFEPLKFTQGSKGGDGSGYRQDEHPMDKAPPPAGNPPDGMTI